MALLRVSRFSLKPSDFAYSESGGWTNARLAIEPAQASGLQGSRQLMDVVRNVL